MTFIKLQKTKINIKFLVILGIISFFAFDGNARKIENTQFTLISYKVSVSKEFRGEIAALNSSISKIKGYSEKDQDKLMGRLYNVSYPYIEEKLEQRYGMDILPVNSYANAVKYNQYSFPDITIKKAQQIGGNSRYYIKIILRIESTTPTDKDVRKSVLYANKTSPKITIEAEVYEKIGVLPIGKATGIATVTKPQRVDEIFLEGFTNNIYEKDVHHLDETLFALILEAINEMLISFDKNI